MHLLYYSFVVFLDSAFLLRHATFYFSQSHGSTHNSPHRIVSQQHSCLHRTTFAALLLFTRFFHRQNIQIPSFAHQQPRYIISALTLSSCHFPWLVKTEKWSDGDQWVKETAGASKVSEEAIDQETDFCRLPPLIQNHSLSSWMTSVPFSPHTPRIRHHRRLQHSSQ